MRPLLFIILLSFFSISCNRTHEVSMPGAHGNAGNILVVMEDNYWDSIAGDGVREVFHRFCRALPRSEYKFSLHQVPLERFIDQNRYHRNIIFAEIHPNVERTKTVITRERFARRQLYVTIKASSQQEFANEVRRNTDRLLELFLTEDRDRYLYHVRRHTNNTIVKMLREKHNVSLNIPRNYSISENRDNFVWISFETVKYLQGIFVYHYPLTEDSSMEQEYLIKMRDSILKKNVPGPSPGSYMATELRYYPPYLDIINHNNQKTAHIRGLWRVEGDFMGGPFVSYTKFDEARNRVVVVEGWIYHPNENMRDRIRILDAILYTFRLL